MLKILHWKLKEEQKMNDFLNSPLKDAAKLNWMMEP